MVCIAAVFLVRGRKAYKPVLVKVTSYLSRRGESPLRQFTLMDGSALFVFHAEADLNDSTIGEVEAYQARVGQARPRQARPPGKARR